MTASGTRVVTLLAGGKVCLVVVDHTLAEFGGGVELSIVGGLACLTR